jgi:hypothetical protein
MFVVNVPSFFSILYSVAKPLIPPDTKKKIHVVTSKHTKEELLKYIDAEQLPHFLGGNCVCDPNSKTEDKGCLSSDRGPWNQAETDEDFVSIADNEIYDSRSFISAPGAPQQLLMDSGMIASTQHRERSRKASKCSSFCCL